MKRVAVEKIGALSALGSSYAEILANLRSGPKAVARPDLSLRDLPVDKLLGDRRLSRAIAHNDSLGLLALDQCGLSLEHKADPDRTAMFVGAQCPPASDNGVFARAMEEANFSEAAFGKTYNLAHPMALLKSLANNVLCYGAIRLNAKGVNSNYTNMDTAGHVALIQAMHAIQYDKADLAYAGAYTSITTDEPFNAMYRCQAYMTATPAADFRPMEADSRSTLLADGSVFFRLAALPAGGDAPLGFLELLDGDMAQDLSGPHRLDADAHVLIEMIAGVLKRQGLTPQDIGSVFVSGNGHGKTDRAEEAALAHLWPVRGAEPRRYCLAPFTGNSLEVGGLLDVAVAGESFFDDELRRRLSLDGKGEAPESALTLILRAGLWGDYSCVLIRNGGRPC